MTDGQFSRAVNSVNFRTFKFDLTFVSFFCMAKEVGLHYKFVHTILQHENAMKII